MRVHVCTRTYTHTHPPPHTHTLCAPLPQLSAYLTEKFQLTQSELVLSGDDVVKPSLHLALNGAQGAKFFLATQGAQMLPSQGMFAGGLGGGHHSSILDLKFHNCFYSDRVSGTFFFLWCYK